MGDDRRPYDSPLRRRQMEVTRDRILGAGAELVRELETWDWSDVTFKAVAQRAEVAERTVFRHFPTERDLRYAIMGRLAEEAGVDYQSISLDTLSVTAARVFRALGTFTFAHRKPPEPQQMADADQERRKALLDAVSAERPDWDERQRTSLAAVLDVLWSIASYERLVGPWGMSAEEATAVIGWALDATAAETRGPM